MERDGEKDRTIIRWILMLREREREVGCVLKD